MIFGNYSNGNNFDKQNKITSGDKAQKTNIAGDIKTDAIKSFYDKIRLNVPEKGKFDVVVKEFTDPLTGDEYRLFIAPSHIKGEDDKRRLSIGLKIPDTGNMRSLQIMKGTKLEILDFVGNEKNISQLNSYAKVLKESAGD